MAENLLTIEQAAKRLQIHPASVRRQLREGSLRGLKRGKLWRVPESALYETTPAKSKAGALDEANAIWIAMQDQDGEKRNAALMRLFRAPQDVQAIIMQRSSEAAERYYATPEGEAELGDWRALDGEPFHDDAAPSNP